MICEKADLEQNFSASIADYRCFEGFKNFKSFDMFCSLQN